MIVPIPTPNPRLGGDVIDDVATRDGPSDTRRISEVAGNLLDAERGEMLVTI